MGNSSASVFASYSSFLDTLTSLFDFAVFVSIFYYKEHFLMFFEKFNYITKSEPLRFAPSTLVNIHYIVYDVIIFLSTPVKIVTFIVKFICNFQLPSLIPTFISVKIIIFILHFNIVQSYLTTILHFQKYLFLYV